MIRKLKFLVNVIVMTLLIVAIGFKDKTFADKELANDLTSWSERMLDKAIDYYDEGDYDNALIYANTASSMAQDEMDLLEGGIVFDGDGVINSDLYGDEFDYQNRVEVNNYIDDYQLYNDSLLNEFNDGSPYDDPILNILNEISKHTLNGHAFLRAYAKARIKYKKAIDADNLEYASIHKNDAAYFLNELDKALDSSITYRYIHKTLLDDHDIGQETADTRELLVKLINYVDANNSMISIEKDLVDKVLKYWGEVNVDFYINSVLSMDTTKTDGFIAIGEITYKEIVAYTIEAYETFQSSLDSLYFRDFEDHLLPDSDQGGVTANSSKAEEKSPELIITPNPVNELIFLTLDNPAYTITNIYVYSLNGQKINTFTPLKKVGNSNQTHTIDMSGLNNGHYIIVLDLLKGDNNVTSVRKRIVIDR